MLKAIVHGAILSLLFVGCSQKLPECKSDEDKITGCVERGYYDSGQLEWETPYKDGKENGVKKRYYENGRLKIQTPYKDDKIEGVWKKYYENGQLESEALYKNGDFVSMKQFPLNTKQ